MKLISKIPLIIIVVVCLLNISNNTNSNSFMKDIKNSIDTNFAEFEKNDKDYCLSNDSTHFKNYSIKDSEHIKQMKFIDGKCNPVLIVPGLLASRIRLVINCDEINKDKELIEQINFYCGANYICKDANKSDKSETRSYDLWPSILGKGFSMAMTKTQPVNSCFGYFFQFYNTPTSCSSAKGDVNSSCRFSEHIRIIPYGAHNRSEDPKHPFKCGFNSVSNFGALGNTLDRKISLGGVAGFLSIENKLVKMGYSYGANLAAVPYDFREAYCQNTYFKETLTKQLTQLYNNAGKRKKVIVIAHSYGNINLLQQLINNPSLKDMIQHYIALAPPYAGAVKADLLIAKHSMEFNIAGLLDYSRFAQSLSVPFNAGAVKLRPFNYLDSFKALEKDKKLPEGFTQNMQDYVKYETCLAKNNFDASSCGKFEFHEILKDVTSWMTDEEICKKDPIANMKDFETKDINNDDDKHKPINNACHFKSYDINNCAEMVINNSDKKINYATKDKELLEILCFKNPVGNNRFYITSVDGKKQSADKFIEEHNIKPENYKSEMNALCKARKIVGNDEERGIKCDVSKIPKEFFTRYNLKDRMKDLVSLCRGEKDSYENLYDHDLNTTIIFSRAYETRQAFFNKKDEDSSFQERIDTYMIGGDGTVPGDSTYIPSLGFFAQRRHAKKSSVFEMLDYCAPVSNKNKFKYQNPTKENKNHIYKYLDCSCKTEDSNGKITYKDLSSCSHAALLNDSFIVDVVAHRVMKLYSSINFVIEESSYKEAVESLIGKVSEEKGKFVVKNPHNQQDICKKIFTNVYFKNFMTSLKVLFRKKRRTEQKKLNNKQ